MAYEHGVKKNYFMLSSKRSMKAVVSIYIRSAQFIFSKELYFFYIPKLETVTIKHLEEYASINI